MKIERVILPERMYNQISFEEIELFENELPALLSILLPDFGFSTKFSNKICTEIEMFGTFMKRYGRRNIFTLNRENNEPLDAVDEIICIEAETKRSFIVTISDSDKSVMKITKGDDILLTSTIIESLHK